jgi:hypothetical protein
MKESHFKALAKANSLDSEEFRVALILEKYGLKLILKDNRTNLVELFVILESLGYINLGIYIEGHDDEGLFGDLEDLGNMGEYRDDYIEDISDRTAEVWERDYYDY